MKGAFNGVDARARGDQLEPMVLPLQYDNRPENNYASCSGDLEVNIAESPLSKDGG